MELSIFRVVQECLTNILRHAGSSTAGIRITQDKTCVRVEIEDAGKGIPLEKQIALQSSAQSGVGVRGMRERLRRLGGTLQIHSNGKGTLRVIAVLPITHSLMTLQRLPLLRLLPSRQLLSRLLLRPKKSAANGSSLMWRL